MEGNIKKQKSLVLNSLFNVFYKVMNMVFPLITTIYVSHILYAKGIGIVSTAQNFVQYFVLIAPLGLSTYGTREIAKIRDDKRQSSELFTEFFLINASSTAICSLIYYCIVILCPHFKEYRLLYLIAGLPIVFNLINVEWYYQGQEEFVYIAVRSIIVKFVSVIAIILFVRSSRDYLIYALIYVLGIVGNYIFNISNLIRRGVRLDFSNLNISRHLIPVIVLLCSNIAVELYTLLDTTMLGVMCSDKVVGYYTNASKLVKMIVSLLAAMGGVLLPRLSYYRKLDIQKECNLLVTLVTKIMLFLTIPCAIGTFLLADKLVIVMFGESFLPAITTVRIGTLIILVLGFSNLFGTQVLLTYNMEKKLLICTCVGAISNILMNSVLIPIFKQNGAMIASVVSESIVTFMTIFYAKRCVNINIKFSFWGKTLLATLGMLISVCLVLGLVRNSILCIVVSILCGGGVYFLISYLVKNDVIMFLANHVSNKIIGEN